MSSSTASSNDIYEKINIAVINKNTTPPKSKVPAWLTHVLEHLFFVSIISFTIPA